MKPLIIIFLGVFNSLFSFAQCRPATASENEIYNRVVTELKNQFTTKTPAGEWKVFDEKHSMGNLEVTAEWGNFLHLCTDRYDLLMESSAASANRKAIKDTMQPTTSFYVARDTMYQANANAIIDYARKTYAVSVEMNLGNYRLQHIESARFVETWQPITVAGTTMAMSIKLKPDLKGAVGREETVIFLGGWHTKPITNGKDIRFQPQFRKNGKLFENLVITITAASDITQEIVKQIDWKSIANTM